MKRTANELGEQSRQEVESVHPRVVGPDRR